MRRIVTGIDAAGRSCLVSESEVTFDDAGGGIGMHLAYSTAEQLPPARPAGRAGGLDLGLPPGRVSWSIVRWPANGDFPLHHTDTVDFDLVLEGGIELLLDDGAHALGPGDCVVVTGVDHGWRSGPAGCTMSVLLLGTPPPG